MVFITHIIVDSTLQWGHTLLPTVLTQQMYFGTENSLHKRFTN